MSAQIKDKDELINSFVDERVKFLIPHFESIAHLKIKGREQGTASLKGWKALALQEINIFKTHYPDEKPEGQKTYGSCWRQLTTLEKELHKAALTQVEDRANTGPVRTITKHFVRVLKDHFLTFKVNANADYRQRVYERSNSINRSQVELHVLPYIWKANEILKLAVSDENIKPDWKDVSCALALVSGRRMAEIHLSAEFELIDGVEDAVLFTGQLKGKDRRCVYDRGNLVDVISNSHPKFSESAPVREVGFVIPTLVEPHLVVGGLKFLEREGKRFSKSEDTSRVNARFNKDLAKKYAESWCIFTDENIETIRKFDSKWKPTYHKLRSIYFVTACEITGVNPLDAPQYLTNVLGDSDKESQNAYKTYSIKG